MVDGLRPAPGRRVPGGPRLERRDLRSFRATTDPDSH
jgi:hypothetical protein